MPWSLTSHDTSFLRAASLKTKDLLDGRHWRPHQQSRKWILLPSLLVIFPTVVLNLIFHPRHRQRSNKNNTNETADPSESGKMFLFLTATSARAHEQILSDPHQRHHQMSDQTQGPQRRICSGSLVLALDMSAVKSPWCAEWAWSAHNVGGGDHIGHTGHF